jgi:peptide/nickel transport system substrate-binding protein
MKKHLFSLMVISMFAIAFSAHGNTASEMSATPFFTTPPMQLAAAARTSTAKPTATTTPKQVSQQNKSGGILKTIMTRPALQFGYPPKIQAGDANYANPFFDRLLSVGDGGVYKPMLATSYTIAKDGKSITFKLRQGVKFHDGTDFNAEAVKFNFDQIIAPKSTILPGVTSVDVVDNYTVRFTLPKYNNLVLYQIAVDFRSNIVSPTAIQKNSLDWADTHPVGTGPFMLKSYDRSVGITYVKNPDYWEKGLPYLDGMEVKTIADPMTQMASFKAGEANQIYDAVATIAAQLQKEGWTVLNVPGTFYGLAMESKSPDSIFANRKIREAIEYAIDKEAISSGVGQGLYKPLYQVVLNTAPEYSQASPPRKYDPAKAKQLLKEAGYPDGFSFKASFQETTWRDGVIAVQASLAKVGIKMEVNFVSSAVINLVRGQSQIEKGAAAQITMEAYSNNLFTLSRYMRSTTSLYTFFNRPRGIDALFDQAELARSSAEQVKIGRQITKLLYDDQTVIPLWMNPRLAVLDKTVQEPGWFVNGDSNNHMFGRYSWLKK